MASAPRRYFPGRAPAASEESESSEEVDTTPRVTAPSAPPSQRRKRFAGRVVSTSDTTQKPLGNVRGPEKKGTNSRFVRVGEKRSQSLERNQVQSQDDESAESESESSSSEESSESFADDEEKLKEEIRPRNLPKPVFIKQEKDRRKEDEKKEKEIERREQKAEETRREETKRLMKIAIREEEERNVKREMTGENVPDHEDKEEDREEMIRLWRERERLRLLRDQQVREKWRKDREGGVKKNERDMDEVKEDEDEKEKDVDKKETTVGGRQYKIGPFFMETNEDGTYKEDIYNRDYNQPTLNDRIQSHYQNVQE